MKGISASKINPRFRLGAIINKNATMKPEAKAAQQTRELAKSLETLDHMQLFELVQALLTIKTQLDIGERTRELSMTLIRLIGEWICKPENKR